MRIKYITVRVDFPANCDLNVLPAGIELVTIATPESVDAE